MTDYPEKTMEELQQLIGKNVMILASGRICSRARLVIHGMCMKVLAVQEGELVLEPLIPEYKNKRQWLPLSMMGIEWGLKEL